MNLGGGRPFSRGIAPKSVRQLSFLYSLFLKTPQAEDIPILPALLLYKAGPVIRDRAN